MDASTAGFGAALLLGLSFGAGSCAVACLPLLGPTFLGRGGGPRESWRLIGVFSLGRLLGYTLMATLAGQIGHALLGNDGPYLMRLLVGLGALWMGALVLWRAGRRAACTHRPAQATATLQPAARTGPAAPALFLMGLGMAFSPCAPLASVLLAATSAGSAQGGALLGLGFGAGAILVPALLFGFGVSRITVQIRQQLARWRPPLERAAGVFLMLLGGGVLTGMVRL